MVSKPFYRPFYRWSPARPCTVALGNVNSTFLHPKGPEGHGLKDTAMRTPFAHANAYPAARDFLGTLAPQRAVALQAGLGAIRQQVSFHRGVPLDRVKLAAE